MTTPAWWIATLPCGCAMSFRATDTALDGCRLVSFTRQTGVKSWLSEIPGENLKCKKHSEQMITVDAVEVLPWLKETPAEGEEHGKEHYARPHQFQEPERQSSLDKSAEAAVLLPGVRRERPGYTGILQQHDGQFFEQLHTDGNLPLVSGQRDSLELTAPADALAPPPAVQPNDEAAEAPKQAVGPGIPVSRGEAIEIALGIMRDAEAARLEAAVGPMGAENKEEEQMAEELRLVVTTEILKGQVKLLDISPTGAVHVIGMSFPNAQEATAALRQLADKLAPPPVKQKRERKAKG